MRTPLFTPTLFNQKFEEIREDLVFDHDFNANTPYAYFTAKEIENTILNSQDPFIKLYNTAWKKKINSGKKKKGYTPIELIAFAMTWEYFAKKYRFSLPFKVVM